MHFWKATLRYFSSWKVACTPLEIAHSDISGPMEASSIGGCNYFLTFINEYSRKTWVYFLKHKSDAFGYFQQFKELVEN